MAMVDSARFLQYIRYYKSHSENLNPQTDEAVHPTTYHFFGRSTRGLGL